MSGRTYVIVNLAERRFDEPGSGCSYYSEIMATTKNLKLFLIFRSASVLDKNVTVNCERQSAASTAAACKATIFS
jgi:hypothetical protein